jgi:hypothetical protein
MTARKLETDLLRCDSGQTAISPGGQIRPVQKTEPKDLLRREVCELPRPVGNPLSHCEGKG